MPAPADDVRPIAPLTHVDEHGRAHMVDVTAKPPTRRVAEARCTVRTRADVAAILADPPGGADLVESARYAGILGAKQTSALIPLCHPIRLDGVSVAVEATPQGFTVTAVAEITERTGVEMEALTGCATAALVLTQALMAEEPATTVEDLTLWHKSGGRSGDWNRDDAGAMHGTPPA